MLPPNKLSHLHRTRYGVSSRWKCAICLEINKVERTHCNMCRAERHVAEQELRPPSPAPSRAASSGSVPPPPPPLSAPTAKRRRRWPASPVSRSPTALPGCQCRCQGNGNAFCSGTGATYWNNCRECGIAICAGCTRRRLCCYCLMGIDNTIPTGAGTSTSVEPHQVSKARTAPLSCGNQVYDLYGQPK